MPVAFLLDTIAVPNLPDKYCKELTMKRIWKNYKIWVLVGMAYTGIQLYKSVKIFQRIIARKQKSRSWPACPTQ